MPHRSSYLSLAVSSAVRAVDKLLQITRKRHTDHTRFGRDCAEQPDAHFRPCHHWLWRRRNYNRDLCYYRPSCTAFEGSCLHWWYRCRFQHCERGWSSCWRSFHWRDYVALVVGTFLLFHDNHLDLIVHPVLHDIVLTVSLVQSTASMSTCPLAAPRPSFSTPSFKCLLRAFHKQV